MPITDFQQQSQSAMQSGLRMGSALTNAQQLQEQRQQNAIMNPLRIETAQLQNQGLRDQAQQREELSPLILQQQEAATNEATRKNLQAEMLQVSMMLASYDEEDGKKIIPQLIEQYKDQPQIIAGLESVYQKTGKDYISANLQALSLFSGKPIGGKERSLSEPEKNLQTMTSLEEVVEKARATGDVDLLQGAQSKLENFKKLTNKFGATAQEKADIKVGQAGETVTAKSNIQRRQGYIDSAIDAADGYNNLQQTLSLLGTVKTGGYDAAALKAKQLFGVESADEAQLSANLGKSVLSQLKPIFGSAFTEGEGKRLTDIEAGFGKSTEGNVRLIKETMKIANRAMKRGLKAAKDQGDAFVVEELESMIASFEALNTESIDNSAFPNAPQVGTVQSGFKYNGGDPSLQSSWSKL